MDTGLVMNGLGVSIFILGGAAVAMLIWMVVQRREDLLPIWMPLIFGAIALCYPYPGAGALALLAIVGWLVWFGVPSPGRRDDADL